jgi:hypothetical protein
MTAGQRSSDAPVTPRYGRIVAFAGAVVSTLVTVSAGVGLLPTGGSAAQAAPGSSEGAMSLSAADSVVDGATADVADDPTPAIDSDDTGTEAPEPTPGPADAAERAADGVADTSLAPPADSGQGRRIVFDMGDQRVWLVGGDETVRRSYLVSGSVTDNLQAGTYEVYSRSRNATGIDGSSMDYMVRFTTGDNAAIGFHDIPEMDGEPVQTEGQLGTPLSHGCVRQARPDAVALWRFAPVGTTVVVTT